MRFLTTTLLLVLSVAASLAQRCHSSNSGHWNSVLSCNTSTHCVIHIRSGDSVYVSASPGNVVDTLIVEGILEIANGRKISMSASGTIIVKPGGSIIGGNGGTKFDFPNPIQDLTGPFNVYGPAYGDSSTQGSFYSGYLPVTWLDVEAEYESGAVKASWETEIEVNHNYFEVQWSWDNENFQSYGIVENNEAKGEGIQNYSHVFDLNERLGTTGYVRIKQVDFDGTVSYSPMVAVQLKSDISFSISNGHLTLKGPDQKMRFTVLDIQGRELATSGSNTTLDLRSYMGQLVILKFEEPTITRNIKLVIH